MTISRADRHLILTGAALVATMIGEGNGEGNGEENDAGDELADAAVLVAGNRIAAVGPVAEIAANAPAEAETIDLTGHVLMPGMVNTHHHFFQTLTRAVPAAQDASLFDWLTALYPIWGRLTPDDIRLSTQVAMAELLLSGCTTSSDHLYIYPNGVRLDDSIEAAQEIGMRFHATRGSMSVGESAGGLPPDALVEDEDAILADSERLVAAWHDSEDGAMVRVGLAPCSPFSVSPDLMRETAEMARRLGVGLHTHLAENDSDVAYSREHFGCTPAEYANDLGWTGDDVWHAHCVKLDDAGLDLFARTATGVAHCPSSNMRLASGIAPVRDMLDRGVPVGLGVDGSASNDASHMLAEARMALLLQRVGRDAAALSAREALRLATRGGAQVLGRTDIGQIAPGMMADLTAFDVRGITHAGAGHDPLAALIFCAPVNASFTMVNGQVVVQDGQLTTLDSPRLIEFHNRAAVRLVGGG